MLRRNLLASAVGSLALLFPRPSKASVVESNLRVWVISDGGETWWYVAPSEDAALGMHIRLNYLEAGVDKLNHKDIDECGHLPESELLTLHGEYDDPSTWVKTRTASEWCEFIGEGLLGTTCY